MTRPITFKCPDDLYAWIEQQAKKDSRSVSNYVVWALRQLQTDASRAGESEEEK